MTSIPMTDGSLLSSLRFKAAEQMASHRQYDGRFAKMVLCRAKFTITTKAGLAVAKGEPVLVDLDGLSPGFVTIWSFRNRCLTSVPAKAVAVAK